ncbi:hypothetical protein ABGB18_29385 [Nonomuraea sp. B12E4]|uniref:hypothetical protein n=1 Tax=Nonomuraea sp. B12E4 TaxID=3153564 RepID=UPI00325D8949
MNQDQPGRREPDPNQTVRLRYPRPAPPPNQGPPEDPNTRRLPYTPDMLPDVQHYEAKPRRSAWWWVVLVGGLVVLVAALAVAAVLWARSAADKPRATETRSAITFEHAPPGDAGPSRLG